MNGYYRNAPRFDRIDQEEVPESKHTVFIRGLPGHIKTDEVKDFFEDHVGPCSFDFIKLSQDQLKLFVAVRFETRDAAKECMHKYKDGDVLGYPVEMTWFRDIRRYVSYQQSQGLRPATIPRNRGYSSRNRNSYDRSSRNDYRDDDDYERGGKRKRASSGDEGSKKSRSFSSASRSPSHSPRRSSRERSASACSRRSHHSEKSHRSQSRTSSAPTRERTASPPPAPSPQVKREIIEKGETPPLPPSPPPPCSKITEAEPKKASPNASQSPAERKSRKSKKDKKKRRRRSPSSSSANSANELTSDELSEGELRKKILKKREKVMKDDGEDLKPVVKPTLGKWEEQEAETTLLQNTTLKFGLESTEDVPKRVVRDAVPHFQSTKSIFSPPANKRDGNELFPPSPRIIKADDSLTSFAKKGLKELGKQNDVPRSEPSSSNVLFSTDIDALLGKRAQLGSFDEYKGSQTSVYGSARGQQSLSSFLDDTDETLQPSQGTLRLSSLTRHLNAETERERKLARLPPEIFAKYTAKKKQLEGAFKADRETFGFVARTLIQKDPSLEDRIRLALVEAVKDMEDAFTQKMDQYLDQLIMFITM